MTGPTTFARMSHADRLKWLGSRVITTPDVRKVSTFCNRLYRQAGTKNEGNGGFVLGDTGTGKSTAVAAFVDDLFAGMMAKRPDVEWLRPKVEDTPIRPIFEVDAENGFKRHVVVVVVPPRPRFNSFAKSVGAALGIDLNARTRFGEEFDQIKKQIKKQEVKMIIFDEVQHFVEATMDSYQAADVIKIIMKCQVQVLCIGMPNMLDLVEGANANSQLLRLKQKQIEIQPLACSLDDFVGLDGETHGEDDIRFADTPFKHFCKALDDRTNPQDIVLPFDEPSNLSHPVTALRLWRATNGHVGKIMEMLFQATDLAIEKRTSKLTVRALEAACRDNGVNDKDNWFKMERPMLVRWFNEKRSDLVAEQKAHKGAKAPRNKTPLSNKR